MGQRILFLGTGGDAYVIGKQYRSSGGIILNINTTQIHIDPGPGSLMMAKMASVNLRENTVLMVSQSTMAAANDVNAVASAMTHEGLDKRGVLVCPSSVVEGNNAHLTEKYKNFLEKTIAIDNTKRIGINDVEIEVVEINNDASNVAGYKIFNQQFTITYIPDTGYDENLIKKISDTDILILNVPYPSSHKEKGHMNAEDAHEIIREVKPQLAIITGFGVKMVQADPLYEAREIQRATGVQVIAAKDGMTINPLSFAATTRQRNLQSF